MRIGFAFAVTCAVAAGMPLAATTVIAQQPGYPAKPVRLVIGSVAGGTPDITARTIGPKLSERWGQPVIVDNRPGAAGVLASSLVAKAMPDGYTLMSVSNAFAISAVVHPGLPYDPLKDFCGVTQIGFPIAALVVAPALGVRTVKELIALAQAHPGKLNFGSAGGGSGTHFNAAMFNAVAGIDAVHVAYKGQPEFLMGVVSGQIHYAVAGLGPSLALIKSGKLLALAVTAPQRLPLLPDVPGAAEILPGWKRDGSHLLLAPAGTPRPVLHQISKAVARILDLPDVKERLQAIGFHAAPSTPEEADKGLRTDIETFTKAAITAGLRSQ